MNDVTATTASGALVALSEPVLDRLFPRAQPAAKAAFVSGLDRMRRAGILDDTRRLAMFLAEVGVESGGLTRVTENLNYRAARLVEVWPARFPNQTAALPFAGQPEALANFVYGGRMGNIHPGDGWRFRGRGYLQLTGRDAYRIVGGLVGLPFEDQPDLVATDEGAVASACGVWTWKGGNNFAQADDIVGCSRAINGGTTGLTERRALYQFALRALPGDHP